MKTKLLYRLLILATLVTGGVSCVPGSGSVDVLDDSVKTSAGESESNTDTGGNSLHLIGPNLVGSNVCSPYGVVLKSSNGTVVSAADTINMNLSATGSGAFYSDSSCTIPDATLSIAASSSSANFYAKNVVAEMMIIKATDLLNLVGEGSLYVNVSDGAGTGASVPETISFNAPSEVSTSVCIPVAVVLKNNTGVSANTASALTVNLSGEGTGGYFSDATCVTSINSMVIASGTSHGIVYYENTSAQSLILQAQAATLSSGNHSLNVSVDVTSVATKLSITGSRNLQTSTCSNPYIVRTLNSDDGQTAVSSNTTVDLTGANGGTFYSDAGCTASITQLTIPSASSTGSFYYSSGVINNSTFIADSAALTPGTLDVTVSSSGAAVAEAFSITGPNSAVSAACSSAFTLKTIDSAGQATGVSGNTTVTFAGNGSGSFYSDSGCSSSIASIVFSTGESTKQFYYANNTTGSLVFGFDDAGALIATSKNFVINAGAVDSLELSGSATKNVNECQAYVISTKDAQGNISTLGSSISVNLTGGGSGSFYSDSGCTSVTSSTIMTSGQSQKLIYYKNSTQENVTLSSASAGLTSGTLALAVQSLPATNVALTVSNTTAGTCTAMTATLKDMFNSNVVASINEVVNLAGTGTFYLENTCATPITTTTIASASSSSTFYYRYDTVAVDTITATHGSLTGDSESIQISAGVLNTLVLSGSSTIGVGACSAYTVSLQDAYTNAKATPNSILIGLTGGAGNFYSDATCTSASSSLIVAASESFKVVYYKSNSGETPTLATTNTNTLVNGSLAVTVNVGAASALDVTIDATASAGTCKLATVNTVDNLSNSSNVAGNTAVSLTDSGSGGFFSDAGCTASVASVTILSGASTGTVYYKSDTSQSSTLTFNAAGLTQYNHSMTVNALAPSALVLSGPTSVQVGVCVGYTLSSQDAFNNNSGVSSFTVINMSNTGNGTFYSDSSCTSSITSFSYVPGDHTKFVYFKNQSAESLTLDLDDSGALSAASLAVTTTALPASKLEITGTFSIPVNSCESYSISTTDALGNAVNVGSNLTVNLTKAAAGDFYSDAGCSSSTTTAVILSGTSSITVYYESATPADSSVAVAATSFASDSNTMVINPLVSSELDLVGPTSATVGDCLTMQISVKDSLGNLAPLPENHTMTLSPASGGAFYTDSGCGLVTTSVNMAQGNTYKVVYYKPGTANTGSVDVDDLATGLDLTGASISLTTIAEGETPEDVSSFNPIKLNLTGVASDFFGSCTGPFQIKSFDGNDDQAPVNSDTVVSLSETDLTGSLFYSDGSCASQISTITISSGTTTALFYLKLAEAGDARIQVDAAGLISASMMTNGFQGAELEFSNLPLTGLTYSFSTTPVTADYTVTVTNVGISQASNLQNGLAPTGNFSYTGGTFPGTGGTCTAGTFLNPGQSCTVTVSFSGSTVGEHLSDFGIDYADGEAIREVRDSMRYRIDPKRQPLKMAKSSGANTRHQCMIWNDKTVSCWGNGADGQLAKGTGYYSSYVGSRDTAYERIQSMVRIPRIGDAKEVYVGGNNTCILRETGALVCFGDNQYGQIGRGNTTDYGGNVADFDSALLEVDLGTGFVIADVSIGYRFICAASTAGAVKCWGYNGFGQLGQEDTAHRGDNGGEMGDSLPAIDLGLFGEKVVEISAGESFVCARTDFGNLKCWGNNSYGQLGLGNTTSRGNTTNMGNALNYVYLGLNIEVLSVDAGMRHVCALVKNSQDERKMKCWGENAVGQLGLGDITRRGNTSNMGDDLPFVDLGFEPAMITLGDNHTCALSNDRRLKCFGTGSLGELGNYDTAIKGTGSGQMGGSLPYASIVEHGSQITGIAAADSTTCTFHYNNTIKCWGEYYLQGANTVTKYSHSSGYKSSHELQVHRSYYASDVALGSNFMCAKWFDGSLNCWGGYSNDDYSISGDYRYSGNGPLWQPMNFPADELPIKQVATGDEHTCIITQNDKVKCWGKNTSYQLGLAHNQNSSLPSEVRLADGDVPAKLALGYDSTCLLLTSGEVKCWGDNGVGQLGIGSTTTISAAIAAPAVDFGSSHTAATDIFAGRDFFCAVLDNTDAKCWGENGDYQLGQTGNSDIGNSGGEMGDSLAVIDFGVGRSVVTMALGDNHACAALDNKTVSCWGQNSNGATGLGTTAGDQIQPANTLTSTEDITSLAAGRQHSCASFSDGSAQCWGSNNYYQLGYPLTTTTQTTPVTVEMGGSYRFIEKIVSSSNSYSTCVIVKDAFLNDSTKAIKCWGYNSYSHLGYGDHKTYGISSTTIRYSHSVGPIAGPAIADASGRDYIIPGSYTYNVPNEGAVVKVSIWGPGGGGYCYTSTNRGGGSGGFAFRQYNYGGGQVINFTVGAGAEGESGSSTSGNAANSTTFAGMSAQGGASTGSTARTGSGGTFNLASGSHTSNSYGVMMANAARGAFAYYRYVNGQHTGLGGSVGAFPGGGGSGIYCGTGAYTGGHGASGRVLIEEVLPPIFP